MSESERPEAMSGCSDRQYENMAHAWELGMLSDGERRSFEAHLLECDHCFSKVSGFRNTARLMNRDEDLRRLVAQIDSRPRRIDSGEQAEQQLSRATSIRSRILPISIAAAALLVLLVLKPWRIEFTSTDEVVASENRLTILFFENVAETADSTDLAAVATSLLITDLAQTGVIEVVSTMRLYDIARMVGRTDPAQLGPQLATEVAERSRSRWVLCGSILRQAPQLTLTADLVEAGTGNLVTSFEVTGGADEDIFAVIDRLSRDISEHFVTTMEQFGQDLPVAQITSPSLKAYRYYLDGVDQTQKLYYDQAVASFQKALQFDPELAMAYYYLSQLLDRTLITSAMEHIDQASRIEQFYIRASAAVYDGDRARAIALLEEAVDQFPDEKQAWYLLGRYQRTSGRYEAAIEHFQKAVALDTLFTPAYNSLAYCYDQLGRIDEAVWAADKYVSLAPDEANPYDTKGEILARHGRLKEAIQAFEKALEVNPDYHHSRAYLGYMYIFDGQYEYADSCFQSLTYQSDPALRYAARMYAVYPWIYRAKFDRALRLLDDLIALTSSERVRRISPRKELRARHLKATVLRELGRWDGALEQIVRCREIAGSLSPADSISYRDYHILLLTESGDMSSAQRELSDFREYVSHQQQEPYGCWYGSALVAAEREDYDQALADMRRASEISDQFIVRAALGEICLKAGRADEAATIFSQLLTSYTSPRAYYGIESAKLHYYLGQAYEQLNRPEDAAAQHDRFLELWSEADHTSSSIEDARSRLDRLRHTP